MTDGPTEASDRDRTESNRQLLRSLVGNVLIGGRLDELESFVDRHDYTEHTPNGTDGFESLLATLRGTAIERPTRRYETIHRVLAEGSFVLSLCEARWRRGLSVLRPLPN